MISGSITVAQDELRKLAQKFDDNHQITQDEWYRSFRAISSAFEDITSNLSDIEQRCDIIKSELNKIKSDDIKPLENSFVVNILNKITVLKNVIKENTDDPNGQFFSPTLIAVEKIEGDIRQTKSVTQKQLQQLNDLYIEQKSYKKI